MRRKQKHIECPTCALADVAAAAATGCKQAMQQQKAKPL